MNPVTDVVESGNVTMVSTNKENLINAYNDELTDGYKDDRFHKSFKQNGPLEWYNKLYSFEVDRINHGLHEEWINSEELESIKNKYRFV
jgi:hypothetical protein